MPVVVVVEAEAYLKKKRLNEKMNESWEFCSHVMLSLELVPFIVPCIILKGSYACALKRDEQ